MSLIEGLWDSTEYAWAMRRTGRHRVPLPAVGDRIFYRHRHFGEVTDAQVVAVQPFPDEDNDYQFRVACGPDGQPLLDGLGHRLTAKVQDPWITLRLATAWGHLDTREARLTGSAGWLPVDWETRIYPTVIDGRLTFRRQMEMAR